MKRLLAIAVLTVLWQIPATAADLIQTEKVPVSVETVATGLEHPWGIEVLPDGTYLVTQRPGGLRIIKDGQVSETFGEIPGLAVGGQGGLLDVALARDFEETGTIFLSFSELGASGAGTAIARARLARDGDGARLEDFDTIFSMMPKSRGGRHFGLRAVFADDGNLFFSIGDRGEDDRAQDLMDHAGAILRIAPDGSIPAYNPFHDANSALPDL